MKQYFFFFFLAFVFGISSAQHRTSPDKAIAIRHVNIISMMPGDSVLTDATIIIRDSKIEAINGVVPANALIIDGAGKWLIPGLIDMHVHIPTDFSVKIKLPAQQADIRFATQDLMTPFVANGVTTILNMNANVQSFSQRKEVEKGSVIGPVMAMAALINGGEASGFIANTAEQGRQAVRDAKAEGYEFIKPYSQLNRETFLAIVDEAGKNALKTVGHIPNAFKSNSKEVFVPHFDMIAHAEELSKQASALTDEEAQQFAQMAKQNGTWWSPTLVVMRWIASQSHSLDSLKVLPELKYVHPLLQSKWLTANNYNRNSTPERTAYFDRLVRFHEQLVRAFKAAGVPLVAGTDAGTSGVVGGFSLHDELALLQEAGLEPAAVLRSATTLPAQWLGLSSEIGTIAVGKQADLILLEANPLTDIRNTRKIAGVVLRGRWLHKAKLAAMLTDLAKRNEAGKNQFDWKQTTGR